MKKLIYSLLGASLLLTACQNNDDFFKEKTNGMDFSSNFYRTEDELERANNGLYLMLSFDNARPYESYEIRMASADDIFGTGGQRLTYLAIERNMPYNAAVDANDVSSRWKRTYEMINVANAIIEGSKNAVGNVAQEKIDQYVAQAKFARAFSNFMLVRYFNSCPLIMTVFNTDQKREVRNARPEEIYAQIIEDFEFAEKTLPQSWADPVLARGGGFTSSMATAMLAKVYLQRAGFPVNGGIEDYKQAASYAKKIIDSKAYDLYDNFYEVFDPKWEPFKHSGKEEVIMWFARSKSDYNVRCPNPSFPYEAPFDGWEAFVAENYFFRNFPEGDRKDFTFVTDFNVLENADVNSTAAAIGAALAETDADKKAAALSAALSKVEHKHYTDLKVNHPMYRKYWATPDIEQAQAVSSDANWDWDKRDNALNLWNWYANFKGGNWNSSRDDLIIRYAEILLIYAEAQARANGGQPDALAVECLNKVRNRAYKGLKSSEKNDWSIGASEKAYDAQNFADVVVCERAWELCAEFSSRWFDLVRLDMVPKATTAWRDEPDRDGTEYSLLQPYTHQTYFFPIPNLTVTLNPALAGNNDYLQ